MKKEDIGILGKLVADNFNSMTDKEQKEELENKFSEVVKNMSLNPPNYSNIAKDLVVNEAVLGNLKGFHLKSENNISPKSYSVSIEDLEKMLVASGDTSALEKIKLIRSSASGKNNNNNNNLK